MTRIRKATLALVAVLGLLLAGCGGSGESGGAGGSGAGDTVTVGLSAGFSGQVAFYGQGAQKGIELAIQELNSAGGVQYRLVTADDECTAQGGVSAYRQLLAQERVDVLLGSTCSSSTLAGMPILKSSKIPGMTFSSTNPTVTEQSGVGGNEYSWRMNIDDSLMAETITGLIESQGSRRLALLAPNSDFGRGAYSVYSKALPATGIELATAEYFALNSGDVRSQLTKIGASGADSVLVFGNPPDCVAMVRQMNELKLNLKIFSRAGCATDEALTALGEQAPLLNGVTEAIYWWPTEEQKDFLTAFEAKHGTAPDYNAGLGYHAMRVVAQAVEKGGTDAAGIQSGLKQVDWNSPLGPIKFDDHNQAHPNLFLGTVRDAKVVYLESVPTG